MTSAEFAQFQALSMLSARLGDDPLQIQGAGGNTSIKQGDVMWIKASGKWLMHAREQELFVPVRRSSLLKALDSNDPRAEKSLDFIVDELNPHGLRPSIETSLHAVLLPNVVIHVHCVDSIAIAIRQDARVQLGQLLRDFKWKFIPYVRPGVPLSNAIAATIDSDTNVLVLGNHGLVVAADNVDECVALLESVRLAIRQKPRKLFTLKGLSSSRSGHTSSGILDTGDNTTAANDAMATALEQVLDDSEYVSADVVATHVIAFDEVGLQVAAGGSLYPDHVIFLGQGTAIAKPGENVAAVVQRYVSGGFAAPVSIVFPRIGVVMLRTATAGQIAMARCLSDVCRRVPANVAINYLSERQNHELLHWEAEQYRQNLSDV